MKLDNRFSQHHIYGVQTDKSLNAYRLNSELTNNDINIWQLISIFKNFRLFLDLYSHSKNKKKAFTPVGNEMISVFSSLEAGGQIESLVLKKVIIFLIQACPGYYLRAIQKHFQDFKTTLTPQYRLLIPKVDFSLAKRDELIFHACNPDCYVWIPKKTSKPKRLIIVFFTKNNTLNMPRPIAHHILSKLDMSLMYIGGRVDMVADEYLAGHDLEDSARLILKIATELGFNKFYGIGASYGGFKVCKLASLLKLKKVLNFSGAHKEPDQTQEKPFLPMSSNYPKDKILSILSKSDPVDQKILDQYSKEGFLTQRDCVESKTHGSFTAAFIEDKLSSYFDWLLNDEVGNFNPL
jgi:hypothetical protein